MGQWIVGVISFQKMYGLYGLKHHIVEKSGDVTDPDGQTTRKDRATQLLICEKLSLAIGPKFEYSGAVEMKTTTFSRFSVLQG